MRQLIRWLLATGASLALAAPSGTGATSSVLQWASMDTLRLAKDVPHRGGLIAKAAGAPLSAGGAADPATLDITLEGKIRSLAEYLHVHGDGEEKAAAESLLALAAHDLFSEGNRPVVKMVFERAQLLMPTDEQEARGITLTEVEIVVISGQHLDPDKIEDKLGGDDDDDGDDGDFGGDGGASADPVRRWARATRTVRARAQLQFADIDCAARKWDPALGFAGVVVVPYCFENGLDEARRSAARAAMAKIGADGLSDCVSFVEEACDEGAAQLVWGVYEDDSCWAECGATQSRINMGWCRDLASLGSLIHEVPAGTDDH